MSNQKKLKCRGGHNLTKKGRVRKRSRKKVELQPLLSKGTSNFKQTGGKKMGEIERCHTKLARNKQRKLKKKKEAMKIGGEVEDRGTIIWDTFAHSRGSVQYFPGPE